MHHPTDRIAHTTVFVTPVVEHCLEREIAQWVHPMKDCLDDTLIHGLGLGSHVLVGSCQVRSSGVYIYIYILCYTINRLFDTQ